MKTTLSSVVILLALGAAAGCSTTTATSAEGPAVTSARLSRARGLVKPGMPAPLAIGAVVGLLGPPTLVDRDGSRWMMAGEERCTELRVVAANRVQGVTLFSVTPVAGAQYKACMAAVGQPVIEEPGPPVCPPKEGPPA